MSNEIDGRPSQGYLNHKDSQGRDSCDIVKKQSRQRIARQQSEYEQQQQARPTSATQPEPPSSLFCSSRASSLTRHGA